MLQTPNRGRRLGQDLVVLTDGDNEDKGCHVFKTVDPLAPLRALAANVNHASKQEADLAKMNTGRDR